MLKSKSPKVAILLAMALSTGAIAADPTTKPSKAGIAFFESKIRPVLVKKCVSCHSEKAAKAKKLKGKLLVDSKAGLLTGGESGPAIVPGKPERSLLIQALRHESFEMPPNEKLSDRVIDDFVKWVRIGAPDPRDGRKVNLRAADLEAGRKHWAFQRLSRPKPPNVQNTNWVRTSIDRFVVAKLGQKKLTPTKEADKRTLIRRAYFDLIGLPPSPAEIKQFLEDKSTEAYENLLDRLLASKHYGERWGRHWLDVARFGESEGSDVGENRLRRDAWKYRDAVIKAVNQDLPFIDFVAYQLSGRGISKGSPLAQDLARFPKLGTTLKRSDNPNDKMWHKLDDMVAATGSAFLGITIGCARCHDHKIDPITAEEYYQLTAIFFDQVKVAPRATRKTIPLEIREPHLLAAGSWRRPVKKVGAGFVQVLMRERLSSADWLTTKSGSAVDPRFALARWMVDVDNGAGHLLARVIVNRVWQYHFGSGIVSTANDFGFLGAKPTHPQLLDWLANELIRNDWRLKPLHRLIMRSATYRQASGERWLNVDRTNRWLWHHRARRMEAEIIRDNILSVSGGLKKKMYGPSTLIGSLIGRRKFKDRPATWRRSIYMMAPRFDAHPVLRVFDSVENFKSVGGRTVSTTPTGALFMLNSGFLWRQSELMAKRVESEAGKNPAAQVTHIYEVAFARLPTKQERALGIEFLKRKPVKSGKQTKSALVHYCHAILGLNEFIYVH